MVPPKQGLYFYNNKKLHSLMLMALVDHDYKFWWVEVGANGAASDSLIWNDCDLGDAVLEGSAAISDATPL